MNRYIVKLISSVCWNKSPNGQVVTGLLVHVKLLNHQVHWVLGTLQSLIFKEGQHEALVIHAIFATAIASTNEYVTHFVQATDSLHLPKIFMAFEGCGNCSCSVFVNVAGPGPVGCKITGLCVQLLDPAIPVMSPSVLIVVLWRTSTEELGREIVGLPQIFSQVQFSSHVVFLPRCLKDNLIIPRGLHWKWNWTSFKNAGNEQSWPLAAYKLHLELLSICQELNDSCWCITLTQLLSVLACWCLGDRQT